MGLWPFASSAPEVERATRIVTGASLDGVALRGKLVVHFAARLAEPEAEESAAQVGSVVERVLADGESDELLGALEDVVARALARMPSDVPAIRDLELTGLHEVGKLTTSGVRARPAERPAMPTLPSPPRPAADTATTTRAAPSISATGSAVAPLVQAAVEQLVRDVLIVRNLAALGDEFTRAVRCEIEIMTTYFVFEELTGLGVPQRPAIALVEEVARASFAGESPTPKIGAYLHLSEPSVLLALVARLARSTGEDLEPFAGRLEPLLAAHRNEVRVVAAFLKRLAAPS